MEKYKKILKIASLYTIASLKTSYKEAVKNNHPDKFKNPTNKKLATEKMKLINEAYEYLKEHVDKQDDVISDIKEEENSTYNNYYNENYYNENNISENVIIKLKKLSVKILQILIPFLFIAVINAIILSAIWLYCYFKGYLPTESGTTFIFFTFFLTILVYIHLKLYDLNNS